MIKACIPSLGITKNQAPKTPGIVEHESNARNT